MRCTTRCFASCLRANPPTSAPSVQQPLAEAGRRPLTVRSRGVVPLAELPAQLGDLLAMYAEAAQTTLGEREEQAKYVAALAAAAQAAPVALKRLAAMSTGHEAEWRSFGESARAYLSALSRALTDLHPLEPTPEQIAALAAAARPLQDIEAALLVLLAALGSDQTDEPATAALDCFFTACEAL